MEQDKQRPYGRQASIAARGFTLPEVIIALALFLILSATIVSFYLMSLRTWSEGSAEVAIQRKLAVAMQRIVQGERGALEERQHGLREAKQISIIDPQTIEFTSGVDDTTRRIYLDGNEIIYDSDASTPDSEVQAIYDPSRSEAASDTSQHRTNIQFAQRADGTIEVRLIGEKRVRDRWMNATLLTRVLPRNYTARGTGP
ncbi:MAG: type II secretion system protein [Verrucomicrobia bacterium]|nr:type II secretion system protein [Verrucomicrobiota bacterium]